MPSFLDGLFASNGNAAPNAPPAPPPSPTPNYADFYKQLLAAATADGRAHPTSLFNWLSGRGTDAEAEKAKAMAPAAWQQQQTGQVGVQNAQLGSLRDFASTGALAGTQVDPANPMASLPAMTSAYGGVLNGTPQAAPAGPGVPAAGAPGPQAAAPAAPPIDPVQAQRAMLLRMAKFNMIKGNAQGAVDFYKQANAGVPADTVARPDGAVGDGVTGQPVNTGVGQLLASRAGLIKDAELPAALRSQTHQGNVDVGVHTANANTDAERDLKDGIDTTTGLPITRTRADILRAGGNGFVSKNPYFDGQQAEIKEGRVAAQSADQGLNMSQHIINAANGIFTGKGANTFQEVRKLAQTAAHLTGAPLSDEVLNDTSKFEQLKFASQQLAAVAAHALSARTSNMLYGAIANVKPGDPTSMKGLRDIIANEILPEMLQVKARAKGLTEYYQKNPLKNDGASVVSASTPLDSFHIKSVHDAKPGDYFIDPVSGNMRQRAQ